MSGSPEMALAVRKQLGDFLDEKALQVDSQVSAEPLRAAELVGMG
jgi:hypothetical protein